MSIERLYAKRRSETPWPLICARGLWWPVDPGGKLIRLWGWPEEAR